MLEGKFFKAEDDANVNADANQNADANANANNDADANADANANAGGDADDNSNANDNGGQNDDANANANNNDANANANANDDANSNANPNNDGNSDANADANANANDDGNANANNDNQAIDYNAIPDNVLFDLLTKKTGRTVASLDDLKPAANPFEKITPEAKAFLQFNLDTGRGFEDYISLNQDLSKVSDIDMARERVRKDTGRLNLSNEDCDAFLEKTLDISLDNPDELDIADSIALTGYQKDFRQQRIQEQEKYKTPLEDHNQQQQQQQAIADDMLQMEDGTIMPKAKYDEYLNNRQNYLNSVKAAANKITASSIKVVFDDKGVEKPMTFSYEFSKDDVQEMTANAEETSKVFEQFTHNGVLNTEELMQGIWWANPKNREKAISSLIHKAVAQNTTELLKEKSNVELGRTTIVDGKSTDIKKVIPIENNGGFGIKVPINLQKP